MNLKKIVVALVGLLVLAASTVEAQTRKGRWLGLGLAVGSLGRDGLADTSVPVGHIGIGALVSERLMIAAEGSHLRKKDETFGMTHSFLAPVVYFCPGGSGGFFLKISGGLGHITQESSLGKWSDTSLAVSAGMGVEIPIGENLSIRPFANIGLGGNSTMWTLREIGVGVSWP